MARRNYESLSEEYDIIMMEPKEAHAKFVARVNEHKQVSSSSVVPLAVWGGVWCVHSADL